MHSISSKALALFKEHAKQTAKISVTPKSGNSFVLTEADILTNGFKLNRSSVSGGTVELGSVIASELDLTLENYNERFQGTAFEGAKLFVSICVTDGLAEYPVDFGYFTVDEVLKGKNAITITALDRMVKFDKEIEADFFTDNPNDTFDIIDENLNKIYADSETKLVWKFYSSDKTVSELVKRICYFCGIRLKTDLSTLPNHDYTVVSIPQTDGLTYRHLLSWCCQIMGVCAYMDSDGTLILKWYSESGVELDVGDRYDSVISENSIVLNRLTITVADKTYTSGTGSYAIDLTGNMLVQTNPQEMLDNLCSAIGGLTYIPFTAETVPFPQLEPLDKINIIDKNGNIYPTIITNWTFSLNNSTILAGQGISETKNNYAAAAPFTPAQSFVIEKKSNEIKDEFDSKIEQTRTSILLEVSGKYATGEEVSSALKVTNEAITSEVSRAQSAESGLSSSISQNAEAITAEVTRAKNAESSMSSLIQQNADNILLRVTKKDLSDEVASEVASEIEQSADTIRLKASKIVWQSDKSSMTEDGVLTATGANITGVITAEEGGIIAGFAIKKNMLSYGGDNLAASLFICPDGKSSEGTYMDITIGDYLIEDVVLKISDNFAIGKDGKVAVLSLGCEGLGARTLVLSENGKIDFRGTVTDKALGIYTGWEETLKTAGITGSFNLVENVTAGSEDLNAGEYQVEDVMKYLLSGEDISFSFLSRIKRIEKRIGISESYVDAGLTLDSLYASKSHTHSNYAASGHNHDSSYAAKSHSHTEYASSSHTHSNYALTSHTHSDYALTSHKHGNNELWKGNHFLTSTASSTAKIDLSSNISDQNIGIVLIFSPCVLDDSGNFSKSTDYFYQTFFIPKAFIPSDSYKTMSFALHYEKYNLNGNKILKIYNNKIEGYITNSDAGTSNGITYNNKRFILRAVYGV